MSNRFSRSASCFDLCDFSASEQARLFPVAARARFAGSFASRPRLPKPIVQDALCTRNFPYASLSILIEEISQRQKKNGGNLSRRLKFGRFDRASYLIHRESISLILQGRGSDRTGGCYE